MKKRTLSLMLVLAMIFGLLPAGTFTAHAAEAKSTIYYISDPEDLAALGGESITGTVELTNDIQMSGQNMDPIASLIGSFDGNGYTISGLSLSGEAAGAWGDMASVALIGELDGEVRNLILEDVTATTDSKSNLALAALVGAVTDGTSKITNVAVTGVSSVSAPNSTSCHVGALVGYISASGTTVSIENCMSAADVSSVQQAGGLVGTVTGGADVTIQNCGITGDIAVTTNGGGAIGFATSKATVLRVENCYYAGTISGTKTYGLAYASTSTSMKPSISVEGYYYDNEKNSAKLTAYDNGDWSVPQNMTGVATDAFPDLSISDAFEGVGADGYPALKWYQDLGDTGRTLTLHAPEAASVSLTNDLETWTRDTAPFTFRGLDAGIYSYRADPASADRGVGTGTVVVGLIDGEKTITLPTKGLETVFTVTPAFANITLYDGETMPVAPASMEDGTYVFELQPGDYSYAAEAFGYEPAEGAVTVPPAGTKEITLAPFPTTPVTFTVSSGEEIPAISVTHDDTLVMTPEPNDPTLYRLPEGSYGYTVSASGYLTQNGVFTVPETTSISVTLEPNTAWDGTLAKELAGDGTPASPYLISNGRELALFAQRVNDTNPAAANASVLLTGDIDLGGVSWTPIGNKSVNPFRGHFDGQGYRIQNLNVEKEYAYYGLFGCLTDATVENLTVSGEVYCSEPYARVGGLSGYAMGNVTIKNCANLATVSALARGGEGIGGLIGGYDDGVEYQWTSVRLRIENSYNAGLILCTGADADRVVGGLVGANKNCVQLLDCYNVGEIYAPDVTAAGLLGNAGWQTGDCHPSITNCYNAGKVTGADGKAFALYGKGTIAQSRMVNSLALEGTAPAKHPGTQEMNSGALSAAAATLGNAWAQSADKNEGFPYLTAVAPVSPKSSLKAEADQYQDVIAAGSDAAVNDILFQPGADADPDVTLLCIQTAEDIQKGYLLFDGDTIRLKKTNTTAEAVIETATLCFRNETGQLRKPISIIVYPSSAATVTLMDKIAAGYTNSSDDWVIFDMAAYAALKPESANKTAEAAKQNYVDLTVNALPKATSLATDRAKAEIILGSLGIDTTQLYPFEETEAYNNALALQTMDLGSSYYAAPWILLADQQGQTNLTPVQIRSMVGLLRQNQGENGLFYSIWGTTKYDDVDTTGTALAAVAKYYLEETDTYGIKDSVTVFVDKALDGLSRAQGANGSFGNVNSDAMVITGLTALGIDPAKDSRFIKNGCSLADALLLYVNAGKDGFTSVYLTGTQGEKAQALATEQGFRALIALAQMKTTGGPFNIYAPIQMDTQPPVRFPAYSNSLGTVSAPTELPESDQRISVTFTVQAGDETLWIPAATIVMPQGATVYHVFQKALQDAGMTSVGADKNYIRSITKGAYTLSEFDQGPNSGWFYSVNGKVTSIGIQDYTLQEGDQILFFYAADWTQEPAAGDWGGSSGGGAGTTNIPAGKDGTVSIPYRKNGNKATLELNEGKREALVGTALHGQIDFDLGSIPGVETVAIPRTQIQALFQADAIQQIEFIFPNGKLRIHEAAFSSINSQLAGTNLSITLRTVNNTALNPEQQTAVKGYAVYEVSISDEQTNISAFEGQLRLSLPYKLGEGAQAEDIYIWHLAEDGTLEKLESAYQTVGETVQTTLTHLSFYAVGSQNTPAEAPWSNPFTDVSETDWFYEAVAYVYQAGLLSGTGETLFSPNLAMTRGMMVTLLWRMEGQPQTDASQTFQDVPAGQWYSDATVWAAANGIVSGYGNGMFGPADTITREQLISILYRYAQLKGHDVSNIEGMAVYEFSDWEQTSDYAQTSIRWAINQGLIAGKGNQTLDPKGTATRAEVSTVLQLYGELH